MQYNWCENFNLLFDLILSFRRKKIPIRIIKFNFPSGIISTDFHFPLSVQLALIIQISIISKLLLIVQFSDILEIKSP